MLEPHKIELRTLTKKYKIFKRTNTFLIYYAILLLIFIILEEFGIIDVPLYESRLVISLRVFLNTWVGIPYIFIEKKMKKIDARIREIESMYEKNSQR